MNASNERRLMDLMMEAARFDPREVNPSAFDWFALKVQSLGKPFEEVTLGDLVWVNDEYQEQFGA